MRKQLLSSVVLCASVAWGQPSLRSQDPVVNGASYSNSIAPGSVFVVFGANLGGEAVVVATSLPLQTTMAGASIRFTPVAGGSPIDALMAYTTRNQLSGLLPSSAAPGDYNVTVTYNGQTTPAPGRVRVAARSLGLISAAGSGSGQAVAQGFRTATEWDLNRFARGTLGPYTTAPSNPGQVVVLWATGLGADSASDSTGQTSGDRTAAANVRVLVGGVEVTPGYAGRAPGLPGTDQLNIVLPAELQAACSVPVQVRVGDTLSNTVTLAIATSGQEACPHPFLSAEALRRMSAGGSSVLGSFSLSKQTISISAAGFSLETTSETASGSIARYGVGNLADYGVSTTPVGTCIVMRSVGSQEELLVGAPPAAALDAGAQLTLNGPNASNIAVPRSPKNLYSKSLTSPSIPGLPNIPGLPGGGGPSAVIAAGNYTLAAPGGVDVGAFTAGVAVPAPVDWTNRSNFTTVNRGQNQTITWTGGGSNVLLITGISGASVGGTQTNPIFEASIFVCYANASAGTFTVPSSILTQLPASKGDITSGSVGLLGVQVSGPATGGTFTAPLTAGGNIDYGKVTFSLGVQKTVTWQ